MFKPRFKYLYNEDGSGAHISDGASLTLVPGSINLKTVYHAYIFTSTTYTFYLLLLHLLKKKNVRITLCVYICLNKWVFSMFSSFLPLPKNMLVP